MKKILILTIMVLTFMVPAAYSQLVQWDKQGVASGTVNDVYYHPSPIPPYYWLATESGIFSSDYPDDLAIPWMNESAGLVDLSIRQINGLYETELVLAALGCDGVYARFPESELNWHWADTTGLENQGDYVGYRDAVSIAVADRVTQDRYEVYLAVNGVGIFTRGFCKNGAVGEWCTMFTGWYDFGPDDMESGQGPGYIFDSMTGTDTCSGQTWAPNDWAVVDHGTGYSHSPTHAWFASDVDTVKDAYLVLDGISLTGNNRVLEFYHAFDLEGGYDGAVLEIFPPTSGVWEDLGPYITEGQYNGTISTGYCSPIGGREAWTGDTLSTGFQRVEVDLSNWAYQTVMIRWRIGCDSSMSATGWYIDDIAIGDIQFDLEPWYIMQTQIPNPYVTALYYDETYDLLYAATESFDPYFGTIYAYDGSWSSPLAPIGVDYISLSGPASVASKRAGAGEMLAGTRNDGVYVYNGSQFTRWCDDSNPPTGDFVSVFADPLNHSVAATNSEIYILDPTCPAQTYYPFAGFPAWAMDVQPDTCVNGNSGVVYVGTQGTGLMMLDCFDPGLYPYPLGNEGQMDYEAEPIKSKNVSRLVMSKQPPYVFYAASRTDSLYKSKEGIWDSLYGNKYFVKYFHNPNNPAGAIGGVVGTCVAIPDSYGEDLMVGSPGNLTVFLGTDGDGVFRSDDGGASWMSLPASPQGVEIVDIVLSPGFMTDGKMFLLTGDATVYRSDDSGVNWVEETVLPPPPDTVPVNRGYDLVISPDYENDHVLFVATDMGLYRRTDQSGWEEVYAENPVLCVDLSPLFSGFGTPPDIEGTSVVAGTMGAGLVYSVYGGGWGSFFQVSQGDVSSVIAVKTHPPGDAGFGDLLTYYVKASHGSGATPGIFYSTCVDEYTWSPEQNADPFGSLYDYNINSIVFHPEFDRTMGNGLSIFTGHEYSKVWEQNFTVGDWWQTAGFYSVPPQITDLAAKPDQAHVVTASTLGYGVMISFDSGLSFSPAGALIRSDNTIAYDLSSVSITDTLPAPPARIMAGTTDSGIFYRDYDTALPLYSYAWNQSDLTSGEIFEIRYGGPYCDVRAASDAGPYATTDFGETWSPDTAPILAGLDETGDCYTPGRGISSFTWGARSGLSIARAGDGGAWLKMGEDMWLEQSTDGLTADDRYCDFRSIIQLSDGTVLMGCAANEMADPWIRVYRGDGCPTYSQRLLTCYWSTSDEGLETTSGEVAAFAVVGNGVLIGVEESEPYAMDGGVYFSDVNSGGSAWVNVTGMGYSDTCLGSSALASGTNRVYSGTDCDGIYASTIVTYEDIPTAYYSWEVDPWVDTQINYTDRSAGFVTAWDWDFDPPSGYDVSGVSTVSHDYLTIGSHYLAELQATNSCCPDTYQYEDGLVPVTLIGTTIETISFASGEATLTWSDAGAAQYRLHKSTTPDGASLDEICSVTGLTCTDTGATEPAIFYRIQAIP